ncbi:MAG TPA: serine protease, partial [Chitinophagales bacterium]|nr:serine protease [Chitinophagales bacterium]
GVRVKALTKGKIATETDIRQGFIITGVDGKPINSTEQLLDALEAKKGGGVLLEGVYPNTRGTYYYGLGI